jgi:starch phosphorylase
VFTTHTPVPAGHDQFPADLVNRMLGRTEVAATKDVLRWENYLNMTYLALNLSHYVNGVAKKHAEVLRQMFAHYRIDAITNGVHATTWTSQPFQALFDQHAPGWREENFTLRYALSIPPQEVWEAHDKAKRQLIEHVNRVTNAGMEVRDLTIGFARRDATYKRGDLVFRDLDRLKQIAPTVGRVQIIYAGKAHPHDPGGKEMIKRIFKAKAALKADVKIAYLINYDWQLAQLMTAGVDVWLNTPQPPLEASGTSGMKAALIGVPSLSILDGWWIEGCIEGVTGWAIGKLPDPGDDGDEDRSPRDAASLYDKLERVVIPLSTATASDSSTSCDTPSRSTAPFSTRSAWCCNTSRRPIFADRKRRLVHHNLRLRGGPGLGRFLCTLEKRDGGRAVSWSRAGWTERTRKTMPKTTRH